MAVWGFGLAESNVVALSDRVLPGRVLIADDTLLVRVLLRTILAEAGHVVVGEATTGRDAVSLFRLYHPDIVLMDITMPGQDGLKAMEEILAQSAETQIIVCSAMAFRRTAIEAMSRGARDFITKPFRPQTVLQAVEGALHRRKASAYAH